MPADQPPDAARIESIKTLFENDGFTVKVGG